jgi:4-hydroxybenzoate polyprenyltransferase
MGMKNKLAEVLRLVRIEHSIMLVIAVISAEALASGIPDVTILLLSLITPIFISIAAFAINDYFDVEADAINGKNRPLVKGTLSKPDALHITYAGIIIGIGASLFLNAYCAAIAVIFGILSILYSYRIKILPFWGNAYVALSMAIPFIFGNFVVSSSLGGTVLLVSMMIFFSGFAREIQGAIRDIKGDKRARDTHSIPSLIGIRASSITAAASYAAAIAISVILFISSKHFDHNAIYAIPIFFVDLALVYSSIVFLQRDKRRYGAVRNISLGAMGLALIAIFLSSLAYIQIPL